MNGFWQDVVYGFRNLLRQRGYTALALTVLGTAIGLNAGLFTAFNAMALRPWPVPEADRMVRIFSVSAGDGGPKYRGMSVVQQQYLDEHSKSLAGVVAFRQAALGSHRGQHVSANFFHVLRVPMALGRGLREADDHVGAPPVAVVSHRLWQQRFAGAADVVGKTLELRKMPFTIVGVTARGFTGTSTKHEDVWVPLSAVAVVHPNESWPKDFLTRPEWGGAEIAGRLADGVSMEKARAELDHLNRQFLAAAAVESQGVALGTTSILGHLRERGKILPVAGLLFLALTLVLLLACANVGNVVLARGIARRQEIAVRLSLGASRRRIVRQLLTESLVLAACAGLLGVGLAWAAARGLLATIPDLAADPRPDLTVLTYLVAIVSVACLTFGLAPALHCTRTAMSSALSERSGAIRTRFALRGALLAIQVAVSVVLLASAGLLVRGVQRAATLDPGFDLHGVAVASFSVDDRAYDDARKQALLDGLERELSSLAGAPPFGFTNVVPLGYVRSRVNVQLPAQDKAQASSAFVKEVSPGYFDVLKIPVLLGRNLDAADRDRHVVIASEALAHRFWPGESPLGRSLVVGQQEWEVVGVVADARTDELDAAGATVYLPIARPFVPSVLIRNDGRATQEALAAITARLDPKASVRVQPLAANIDHKLSPSRTGAILAGAIGLLGLVLATIGLSGVFAYAVHQRTREIGVRVALGAQSRDVVRLVLSTSSRATMSGVALGLLGALAVSGLLRSHLYGLSPVDPVSYAAVVALLSLGIAIASYVPARRAMRVDPSVALRYE